MNHSDGISTTRQYNLHKPFQEDMERLLDSGSGKDLVFVVDDAHSRLQAHAAVVAVRCNALRSRIIRYRASTELENSPREETLCIAIGGVSLLAFRKVLKYLYTGRIALLPEDIFDVCSISATLGIPSLQNIVFIYLRDNEHTDQVALVLDRALRDKERNHMLIAKLTCYLAENCCLVLEDTPLELVSAEVMIHIVKQENLAASELELWEALVKWSCCQSGVAPQKSVSRLTSDERRKVAESIQVFCRPGLLRVLNFDARTFANEVEPLHVFPASEVLLKYRFDAAVGNAAFEDLFPMDRYNFLLRVRQRTMCFESDAHPHPRGVSRLYEVALPRWVSEARVVFDARTALGRYADLEFFGDVERTVRLFSVSAYQQNREGVVSTITAGAVACARRKPLKPIYIRGNIFWFSFYAPQNVGDLAWGYKFFVSIVR